MSKSNIKRLRNNSIKLEQPKEKVKETNIGRQVVIANEWDKETKKPIGEYRIVRVSSQCDLSDYEIARNYNGYAL
jgi:hypothetical protein